MGGSSSNESPYALMLYPEISWRSDTWFIFARALVSPLDQSTIASLGLQWAPLQGFKLIATGSLQLGQSGAVYVGNREGSWQASLGSRFTF